MVVAGNSFDDNSRLSWDYSGVMSRASGQLTEAIYDEVEVQPGAGDDYKQGGEEMKPEETTEV